MKVKKGLRYERETGEVSRSQILKTIIMLRVCIYHKDNRKSENSFKYEKNNQICVKTKRK